MLPLDSVATPTTADGWRDAITDAVARRLTGTPTVRVTGVPPTLDAVEVDASGCTLVDLDQPDVLATTPYTDRVGVGRLAVTADPITVRGIAARLDLSADRAAFELARNGGGLLVAAVADAAAGRVTVRLAPADLDAAVLAAARGGAAEHGVDVRAAHVTLAARSPRDLDVVVELTVKKFVTFPLRVAGRVVIDDALTATLSNLTVDGTGMAAKAASAVIRPLLGKANGHNVPLASRGPGTVRLRDVSVDVTDGLRVTATFGGGCRVTKHVIVIGGGVGGLSAAIRLAAAGVRVTLLEKNSRVGGKLNLWEVPHPRRPGERPFRFDTGPSLLTLPFVFEQLFAAAGEVLADHLDLVRLDPIARFVWPDGATFALRDDAAATAAEVARFAPADEQGWRDFYAVGRDIWARTADLFLYHSPEQLLAGDGKFDRGGAWPC